MAMERRLLMCRTRPVLAFDYDTDTGQAASSGTVLDDARLPLELREHGRIAATKLARQQASQ